MKQNYNATIKCNQRLCHKTYFSITASILFTNSLICILLPPISASQHPYQTIALNPTQDKGEGWSDGHNVTLKMFWLDPFFERRCFPSTQENSGHSLLR